MSRPGKRKLVLFGLLSLAYGAASAIVVIVMAIRTCGMHPDYVAECDTTPVTLTMLAAAGIYIAGAAIFFKRRISGVD